MARRCYRCFRSLEGCLCKKIKSFDTVARIVILMHPMEAYKERTGTGRLTRLALKNSEIIVGVDFSGDKRINELINDSQYFPLMLYPGDDSLQAENIPEDYFQGRTPLIFVIDGTWPCAKKMIKKSENLQKLARISFEVPWRSRFLIKQQPHPDCLSTIESVHVLLDSMGEQSSSHLLEILDMMIEYQARRASDPGVQSYRSKKFNDGEKANYKKATGRSIFHR